MILWHIDLFLGNDCETYKKKTATARQHILNKQWLNYNNKGTVGNGVFYSVRAKWGYITRTPAELQLIESHSVKRRLGGWCEMAASLGASQLKH
jgi:hypothetical protein